MSHHKQVVAHEARDARDESRELPHLGALVHKSVLGARVAHDAEKHGAGVVFHWEIAPHVRADHQLEPEGRPRADDLREYAVEDRALQMQSLRVNPKPVELAACEEEHVHFFLTQGPPFVT